MEFTISEEEAREMARFEEQVSCNLSAGPDYGIHLGKVMAMTLHQVDRTKFVELLYYQLGNVLSREEIEDVASSFQAQLQERITEKVISQKLAQHE